MFSSKIKLVVFDLDYTLWPFYVDSDFNPPFSKKLNGQVEDSTGKTVEYYRDVPDTLSYLKEKGFILGVASRAGAAEKARELIKLFDWEQYFTYYQIFPGCKKIHFGFFKEKTGLEYSQMIFFDDEKRNLRDINAIGAITILVEKGVSRSVVKKALELHKI